MTSLAIPLHSVDFVSIDVETTGLNPRQDRIVELGAVKVRAGQVIDEFSTLVSIDRTIPYDAQRVHGITNAMLVGQPQIDVALGQLLQFVGEGALVEHSNRAFDVAFLEHAHGSSLSSPYLNTCTLSRKLFPFHRSHSLAECCRRHRIINDGAHRALGDARATAQLLTCLLEVCTPTYPTLADLLTVASVQRSSPRPNSGTG